MHSVRLDTQSDIIHSLESLKREAEGLLNFDLETCEDAIAIFDTELNYVMANDATCRLLLKKRYELEGANLLKLFSQLTASVSHR